MEYKPGPSVEATRQELIKSGALPPDNAVPAPAPGVATLAPVVPVGPLPTPGAPDVAAQPGAVPGQPAPPEPVATPKTGEMVQGEQGPNGEPLFYVLHDGIESKLTVAELSQDHSYKAHNTRVGQENADKRRDLELLETRLLAKEATMLNSGASMFDSLLNPAGPEPVAAAPVAPPVQIPPPPPVELAVENPDEYARLVADRDAKTVEHNNAIIQASVASAVKPLVDQAAAIAEQQAEAKKQADMKVRMDAKMDNLMARVPTLDMNLVSDFMARSSHEDVERWNHPDGYELIWGKIQRGEQPGGVAAPAPVVPGYTPPPTAYPAPIAPVPAPPYAEPGAAGGRVAHAIPTGDGAPMPNMKTPEAVAQAIKNKRASVGGQVYYPGQGR